MESALYVVGTPIGNLDDLSGRAAAVLAGVDRVYAEDTRRTGRLLQAAGIAAELRSLHEHNEAARCAEVTELIASGGSAALVSDAGTPVVSDPGSRVVKAVLEADLPVRAVPGPSAPSAALSVSGLSADRYLFLGFPPRSGHDRETWLRHVLESPITVVAFESPQRIADLASDLVSSGLGERRCVLCRELTKMYEEVVVGTVEELAGRLRGAEVRGEVTLVVEGRSRTDWREHLEEARREARERVEAGGSTRDVAAALQRLFGLPRNEAYEEALRAGTEKA
jgi:16S rRNA (cytidine1402-2'-O)-methyltransferase